MRKITLKDGQVYVEGNIPKKYKTNQVSTTLFNRYNFLILGLWYKLQSFVNIYLIFGMILSVIPSISPIIPWTAVVPVVIIITFNLFFDWKQDFNRYRQDRKVNHEKVLVIREYEIQQIKSQDVKIGDIILLQKNREIMADCIIIGYKSNKDCAFIQTKNLDGESNLKPKYPLFDYNFQEEDFINDYTNFDELTIDLKQNSQYLNNIEGEAILQQNGNLHKKLIEIENFLPRGTTLKNTEEAICIVAYVGPETKIRLNTAMRIEKRSEVEKNLDKHLFKIIAIQFSLIFIIYIVSVIEKSGTSFQQDILKHGESYALHFFAMIGGYFLLLRKFLPLSIFFIHIITKLIQNGVFVLNKKYKDYATNQRCGINSYNLAENLGQIEYVLMDKTGTLTQNIMKCKFFMIGNFEVDLNISENNSTLIPYPPFKEIILSSQDRQANFLINSQEKMNELFYTLINTCHECYADFKEGKDIRSDNIIFQGSSHDELALLKACKNELNYFMYHQSKDQIQIKTNDKNINIDKLYKIPFNSDRKKMSVLVKYKEYYFLMSKGAESVLRKCSINKLSPFFEQNYKRYDDLGYRTLFTGIKLLSEREYQNFQTKILQLKEKGSINEIQQLENKLESNIMILGATAVEDRLQEDVQDTLQTLRKANLKLWMITGDKTETAINIGKSTGLVQQNDNCKILEESDINQMLNRTISSCDSFKINMQPDPECSINQAYEKKGQDICVISGDVLGYLTKDKSKLNKLGKYLAQQEVVIFSRASPNQKVQIVRILKNQGKITLSIGDGANDVNMIQEANVGIGIIGNEGKQAERSADYSVPKFKFLKPLLLIFGRKNYFRNSQLINLYFWKSFLFSMPIFYYAFFSKMSRKNTYPDVYITFQDILLTLFIYPFKQVGEIDINTRQKGYRKNLLLETYCYFKGQKNTYFNFRTYFKYYLTACIESFIIFIFLFIIHQNNIYHDNHSFSFDVFSIQLYASIHYYQFFKLFFYIRSYHGFTIFFMTYLFCIYLVLVFFGNNSRVLSYRGVWEKTFSIGPFYVVIGLIIGTLIFLSAIYFTLQHYIYPSIINKIEQSDLRIRDHELEKKLENWREKDQEKNLKNLLLRQFNLIMIQNKEQILEIVNKLLNCEDTNQLKEFENQRDEYMQDTNNFSLFCFQLLESNKLQKKEFQYICSLLKNIANKIQERSIKEGQVMGDYIMKFLFGNQFYILDKQMFCEMLSQLLNTFSQNFYMKEQLRMYLLKQLKDNFFNENINLQHQQGMLLFFTAIYNTKKLLAPNYAHNNITLVMQQFEDQFIKPLLKENFFQSKQDKNLKIENLLLAAKLKYYFLKVYRINTFKNKVIDMSKDIKLLDYIMSFLAFNIHSQQLRVLINSSSNQQENYYLNIIKKYSLQSFQILFKLFVDELNKQKEEQSEVLQIYKSIIQFNIQGVLDYYKDESFNIQNLFLSENQELRQIIEVNLRIFYTCLKQNFLKNIIIDYFRQIVLNIIFINLLLDNQSFILIEENNEIHINLIEDQIYFQRDDNIQSYSAKFLQICCRQIDFSMNFMVKLCCQILSKHFQYQNVISQYFDEQDFQIINNQLNVEQQVIICFKILCILCKNFKLNNQIFDEQIFDLLQHIQNKINLCSHLIQIYYVFIIENFYPILMKKNIQKELREQMLQIMIMTLTNSQQIYQQISIKFFNMVFRKKGFLDKNMQENLGQLLQNLINILITTNNLQIFDLLSAFDRNTDQMLLENTGLFQNYLQIIFQRLDNEVQQSINGDTSNQEFLYQLLNILKLYTNQKQFCVQYFNMFQNGFINCIKIFLDYRVDYDLEILDILQNLVVNTNQKLSFHNELILLLQRFQDINKGKVHNLLTFYDNVILRFYQDLDTKIVQQILFKIKQGQQFIIKEQESLIYLEEILVFLIILTEKMYEQYDDRCIIIIYELFNSCKDIEGLPQTVQKYLFIFYLQLLTKSFKDNPLIKYLNNYIDNIIKLYDKYQTQSQKRFLTTYLIKIFIILDTQINNQYEKIQAKILNFLVLFIKKMEIDQIAKIIQKKDPEVKHIQEELDQLEIQHQINSYIKTEYNIQQSHNDSEDYDFVLQSQNSEYLNLTDETLDENNSIQLKLNHLQSNELYELQQYFKKISSEDAFAIENYNNSLSNISQKFFIQILTQMIYFDDQLRFQIRRIIKVNKNFIKNQLILQKK